MQSVANLLAAAMRRGGADRQKLILLDELRHRVKNMLSTVQSVTALSLRNAGIDRAVSASILERLQALATAHDLNFRREDTRIDLRELIELQCAPYDNERIAITGQSQAELSPSLAIDTSILIHELITNAVKHGALSDQGGIVNIALHSEKSGEGKEHVIEWTEKGISIGGSEPAPGTGSRMIEAIGSQAAISIERDYTPDGLFCRIAIAT